MMEFNDAVAIGAGLAQKIVVWSNRTVSAWGDNYLGALNVPASVSNVVAVDCGWDHTVPLRSDGTVIAWGWDFRGRMNVPPGLTNVVAVSSSYQHSLALRRDGTVAIWGDDNQTNFVAGLSNVIAIAAGSDTTTALLNDGTVVGNNPKMPAGLSNVVSIAADISRGMALFANGTVQYWVTYTFGTAGNPPTDLTNVVAMACGQDNFMVQRPDGTITAWGAGRYEWALFPNYGQSFPPPGLKRVISLIGAYRRGMALYAVAPKPFRLRNSGYNPNGGFSFLFHGEADQSYQIQVSDNLVDWTNVLEVNSEAGPFWINDSDAVNFPVTYYRGMPQDYPTVP